MVQQCPVSSLTSLNQPRCTAMYWYSKPLYWKGISFDKGHLHNAANNTPLNERYNHIRHYAHGINTIVSYMTRMHLYLLKKSSHIMT